MFVLGVDPGLSRCGYGLVARGEGSSALRAHAAGVVETDPAAPLAERLLILHTELRALVQELRPAAVVVERVFFQVNAKTAMSVGQASGLALLVAAEAGCEVVQYTSNEVKLCLVGYGAATKDQVQRMVAQVLGLPAVDGPPDVADALALAVCHLTTVPLRRAMDAALSGAASNVSTVKTVSGERGEHGEQGGNPVIGLLRGAVVLRTGEGEVIIDVAGVGYRVAVTPATAAALVVGASGLSGLGVGVGGAGAGSGARDEATLYVHTHVREDAIVLYGFVHDDERRCFEVLLGSHGVGPTLALAIMAALSPAALSTAVLEEDLDTLCTVPGVGRKTAARLLIELKSRLDLPDLSLSGAGGGSGVGAGGVGPGGAGSSRTSRAEARAALSELGYAPDEIRGALDGLRDDVGVEEMLRLALRELASR